MPKLAINETIIERVSHAKVLGVTLSANLCWNMHVENIVSKASKRLYMLYQVKRAGSEQKDLLKIYLSVIRPVLEYACPVWHPHLTKYLCDSIECIQKRALRCIYPGRLYEDLLGDLHITSLQERRDSICKKYFNTISKPGSKLYGLFPAVNESGHNTRTKKKFTFPLAGTNRFKNSFIPWSIRKF